MNDGENISVYNVHFAAVNVVASAVRLRLRAFDMLLGRLQEFFSSLRILKTFSRLSNFDLRIASHQTQSEYCGEDGDENT